MIQKLKFRTTRRIQRKARKKSTFTKKKKKGLSKKVIKIKIILPREETSDRLKTIKIPGIKYHQIIRYCNKSNSALFYYFVLFV